MSKSNIVPLATDQEENPNRLSFTLEEMLEEFDNGAVPRSKYWRELITALYDTANHVVTGVTSVADVKPDNVGNIPLLPKDIDAPAMVRMKGADERERQSTEDVFGRQLFYEDACKVVHQYGHYYEVLAGTGYVAGIKFYYPGMRELLIDGKDLPTSVWVDVSLQRDDVSDIHPVIEVFVSNETQYYYIENRIVHYVEKIGFLDVNEKLIDARVYTNKFLAQRSDQTQPVTHITMSDAIADDNTNRNIVKILEHNCPEYKKSTNNIYDNYPEGAKFTDAGNNKFVIKTNGFVDIEWFGGDDLALLICAKIPDSIILFSGLYYNLTINSSNVETVLSSLNNCVSQGTVILYIDSSSITISKTLNLNFKGDVTITSFLTTANINTGISFFRKEHNQYHVTVNIDDSSKIFVGDIIGIETKGVNLSNINNDTTQQGGKRHLIDGCWEVISKTNSSITILVNSNGKFTESKELLSVTGGCVYRPSQIIVNNGTFINAGNFSLSNMAVKYIGSQSGARGISCSPTLPFLKKCEITLDTVFISGFTGEGIRVGGKATSIIGKRVYCCSNGSHGISNNSADVSIQYATCSGNASIGIITTQSASSYLPNGICCGNGDGGFLANRSSSVACDFSVALCNGETRSLAKGFESESTSIMNADDSVSIGNSGSGFYSLAGSLLSCQRCLSAESIDLHGYFAIHASSIYCRFSFSRSNNRGFYAYSNSLISAEDTNSYENNMDYVSQGGASIWAKGSSGSSNLPFDAFTGGNSIISRDSFYLPSNLVLKRSDPVSVSSGVITVDSSYHTIQSSGNVDIDTINGGVDGMVLIIRPLSSNEVTIKHNTGNIRIGSDKTLSSINDKITLIYDLEQKFWTLISFSAN